MAMKSLWHRIARVQRNHLTGVGPATFEVTRLRNLLALASREAVEVWNSALTKGTWPNFGTFGIGTQLSDDASGLGRVSCSTILTGRRC